MRTRRVSTKDMRGLMSLVGEVREQGSDISLWHPHLLRGLCNLTGSQVGIGANMRNFIPGEAPKGISIFRTGWADPDQERRWREYSASVPVQATPEYNQMVGFEGTIITRTREQLYRSDLWYRSRTFNDVHRACGIDHYLFSIVRIPGATREQDLFNTLWIHRSVGAPAFDRRDWWLVRNAHAELGRLIGSALASPVERGPSGLTRRQHDVLHALLDGDSEKQIASRLGISATTVHEYVVAVYRHFGVTSRGELLAKFVGRARPPRAMPEIVVPKRRAVVP